ncbi:hypothetical protein AeRB84_019804 [Aphanomyces euteiches]|nr:hypothetical protein AeRB84_019804 [Aphanomyces euteiches]
MARQKQSAPKRQVRDEVDADDNPEIERPPPKKRRGSRARPNRTQDVPVPYQIDPILPEHTGDTLRIVLQHAVVAASDVSTDENALVDAPHIVFLGEAEPKVNLKTIQIEMSNKQLTVNVPEWNLSSIVLLAIAFLNSKKCVTMSITNDKVSFDIFIQTYMDLWYGRASPIPSSPITKHMAIFMRWLIRESQNVWNYPYQSELLDPHKDTATIQSTSLYKFIAPTPYSDAGNAYVPSPNLLPSLRPYQKAAVAWMLQREGLIENGAQPDQSITSICARHTSGVTYNPFSAQFYLDDPPLTDDIDNIRGGILADEMGLGKTVQVLACLLSHPSPPMINNPTLFDDVTIARNKSVRSCVCNCLDEEDQGWVECTGCQVWQHQLCSGYNSSTSEEFYCERCIRRLVPQWSAKSTLIISPQMIHKQWESEILRHTKPESLSILTYSGIKALRQRLKNQPSREWIYCRADKLCEFDVILTTYEALKDDLYHVVANEDNGLRQRKKYRVVASPLSHMKWWRICMDEAQMVENQNTKASLMAMELNSTLRWCVSGTPFSNSLWDVYGTLAFLRVAPFDEMAWWRAVIMSHAHHSDRLGNILRRLMWRNRKQDVIDQINLPPQTIQRSWLTSSGVESHFYRQQLEECLKQRDSNDVTPGMLHSLLRLRQACCHPQVGSHGLKSLDENEPMNMEEVLTDMYQKAQRECEDAQRDVIVTVHGLAGTYILESKYDKAAKKYLEVLSLIQNNWTDFRADLLPRLHLTHNFGLLLNRYCPSGGSDCIANEQAQFVDAKQEHCLPDLAEIRKMIDENLSEVLTEDSKSLILAARNDLSLSKQKIEFFYLNQVNMSHDVAFQKYMAAYENIQSNFLPHATVKTPLPASFHVGWIEALHQIIDEESFVDHLRAMLLSRPIAAQELGIKIRSLTSLRLVLMEEFSKVFSLRAENHKTLTKLSTKQPTKDDIDRSGNCKYCREDRDGQKCQHCQFRPNLVRLRSMLGIPDDETQKSGDKFNVAGFLLAIVHEITKLSQRHDVYEKMQSLMGEIRKECYLAMRLWRAQHARLGGLDELEMAKSTMQLRSPGETIRQAEKIYKILQKEIPVKKDKLQKDFAQYEVTLRTKLSELRYLFHLNQAHHRTTGDNMCVVCHENMHSKCGVWPCAHVFCLKCTEELIQRSINQSPKCPTCRSPTPASKIMMIRHENRDRQRLSGYGTKIDSIVERVQSLSDAKILLFSQWHDMLTLINQALRNVGVHCFVVNQKKDFDKTLLQFKQYPDKCVLAMLFKHGANGLNVVEANHVVLVEPLLNGGVEAQAINRVYRVGQEKQTTVHKFIVRDTVEEAIVVRHEQKRKEWKVTKKQDKEHVTSDDWKKLLQVVRLKHLYRD